MIRVWYGWWDGAGHILLIFVSRTNRSCSHKVTGVVMWITVKRECKVEEVRRTPEKPSVPRARQSPSPLGIPCSKEQEHTWLGI